MLEKLSLTWLVEHTPPTLLAAIFVTFLISWLALRINRVISTATEAEAEQTERIRILEKQQGKLIRTVCGCEKVGKKLAMWLQDDSKNGDDLPEELKK